MLIQSKLHKEIVGRVDGKPYRVLFDVDGYAEVEEAVGVQLLQLRSAEAVPDVGTDVTKMNPAQLKKYAKDNGIDIGEATKKAELLALIQGGNTPEGDNPEGGQGQAGDAE